MVHFSMIKYEIIMEFPYSEIKTFSNLKKKIHGSIFVLGFILNICNLKIVKLILNEIVDINSGILY